MLTVEINTIFIRCTKEGNGDLEQPTIRSYKAYQRTDVGTETIVRGSAIERCGEQEFD